MMVSMAMPVAVVMSPAALVAVVLAIAMAIVRRGRGMADIFHDHHISTAVIYTQGERRDQQGGCKGKRLHLFVSFGPGSWLTS